LVELYAPYVTGLVTVVIKIARLWWQLWWFFSW